jgi:phosphoglucosamine mutase
LKLFGTDGIRGEAGVAPLDRATVARVGAALVKTLPAAGGQPLRILIGRDTRESGVWIEEELARGLLSEAAQPVSAGIIPTPGVAFLARTDGFDAGIVISASHNPYQDNGIKIFSGRGEKLDAGFESAIERLVADARWQVDGAATSLVTDPELCRHYVAHLLDILPDAGPLAGSRLVVDCANGATGAVAPEIFEQLGFATHVIGNRPDGRNINRDCGSTHLDLLQREVVNRGARLGVAFDGDGDRALFVDRHGRVVDGDAVLLIAADYLQKRNALPGNAVVATVMSNIGLELALRERGIELVRAPVGDKYVMEEMQKRGIAVGGEQSGHVIFASHLFTGDGIGTALQVLRIVRETGRELDELAAALLTYPQVLVNVRMRERVEYLKIQAVADAIARVERRLDGQGRLLIRYSGTEPLLRIMLEGKNSEEIRAWANEIADAVKTATGADA